MTTVLEVTGLTVVRDGERILDDVSWTVRRGEHWVLVGPNGSGKTSLLSVLAAYLPATRGGFSVLGERYGRFDWRELRRRIGVVSSALPSLVPASEPGLDVVLSGLDASFGRLGVASGEERARGIELLDRVACGHLAARPWRVLSAGERQRLLIARALVSRPALLFLDEPCAGLDPVAREDLLGMLADLTSPSPPSGTEAPTLVLVTHHVEEVVPGITHALVLSGGRVVATGPVGACLTDENLSRAFDTPVRVATTGGRLGLHVVSLPRHR